MTTEQDLVDRADWFASVVELLQPRGRTLRSIADQMRPFLAPSVDYDPAAVAKYWQDPATVSRSLQAIRDAFDGLEDWSPASIEAALRSTAERAGVGFGKLVHPLRVALTGSHASPGIDRLVWLMGRDLVNQRVESAEDFLRGALQTNVDTPHA
jgi:glutamyl/glutaminyl-tRNA synthetase